jgi:hypothetical protein
MKFCPNCGASLKPEARFCTACGTPITTETPVQPEPRQSYSRPEPEAEPIREAGAAFSEAYTGKTNLIQRVINLIVKPREEWKVIASERPEPMKLIGGYALILALIPALAALISAGVIGTSVMGYTYRSISGGLMQGMIQLFSAVIGVYLLSFVIDLLAPSFESEKNPGRSLQLAVYASTPSWVAGLLLLIPGVKWLAMLAGAAYSVYLLATGMPFIKGTPKDKVTGYAALTIIAMIIISAVLTMILALIFGLFFAAGSISRMGM